MWGRRQGAGVVPRRCVRRLAHHASVISIINGCIRLGQGNELCNNLYPFRDRGAPSFCICPSARDFCYFNYNINNSIVRFIHHVGDVSCARTIGVLTTHTKVPRPRRSSGANHLHDHVLSVGGRTTQCFRTYLGSAIRRTQRTQTC